MQNPGSVFVHPAEARRQFREFVSESLRREDLARGALLIGLEEYPHLIIEEYLARLDELAEKARGKFSPGEPDVFRLGHVQSVLFDEEGFTGDRQNYFNPQNAYLNEVLDRKTGLPIMLSVLFTDVAQRVGLHAVGVGLPGHFIVKVQFDLNEVYVDPFNDGVTLTLKEIDAVLTHNSGGQIKLRPDMLKGWTTRQTLERILANLVNIYSRMGDQRRAAAARDKMQMVSEFASLTEER